MFQLGNSSYRILRVERSAVRVEDARGEAPTIPFWLGEAPGRTDRAVAWQSRACARKSTERFESGTRSALAWLMHDVGIGEAPAAQVVAYLAAAHAALGSLPTQQTIVFERFFDEAGGMQLVIHSPFGSRINRAWGLALRKRFCRTFNFELQAAATEDTIILSLTTAHSFELADVARYLHPNTAREILVQALLAAPMFTTRWRWDASIALALPRFRGGKKVPPALARMNAEDLLASVFPDQVACGENIVGRHRRARSPAGAPDRARLPRRGDGRRGLRAAAACAGRKPHPGRGARSDRAFAARARSAVCAAVRVSSTTHRSKSGARRQ